MGGVRALEVATDEDGQRLDRWFKRRFPGLGHGRLEKLLRTGQVRVDGARVKAGLRLKPGQRIRVPPLGEALSRPPPAPRPELGEGDARMLAAAVLIRDDSVIVLNKPPGLAVQGGSKTVRHLDAMLDALRFGASERPRLAHRLDKDTSGVLVLGRTARATA
ncbi:MAG: pseudouridine synthase, partial [Alphaproteobacteria bacterium]